MAVVSVSAGAWSAVLLRLCGPWHVCFSFANISIFKNIAQLTNKNEKKKKKEKERKKEKKKSWHSDWVASHLASQRNPMKSKFANDRNGPKSSYLYKEVGTHTHTHTHTPTRESKIHHNLGGGVPVPNVNNT